tara:strand:- start:62 stop:568 length:507 start_codon:yes stop_codon:yes gene_type:complete
MNKLKDSRIIKRISFLNGDERVILDADKNGTFRVPVSDIVEGRLKTEYKNLTASEVVAHPSIIGADPVFTLKTGEKIRVFDGGDPSYLPAMSQGIIERHDKFEILRRKFIQKKKILKEKQEKQARKNKKTPIIPPFSPYIAGTTKKDPGDTDEYDNPFYWDDENDGLF